ncbi:MAG: peptidyl-prolyl cis-trans isomerase [Verrucomicrobiota bacterium]
MKRRARAFALVCFLAPLAPIPPSIAETELVDGVAAVVNGQVITYSEVRNAIAVRIGVVQMEMRGATREQVEARIAEIEREALQDLIDRELILDEFEAKGGNIRPQFVEDAVNTFIRERFDGDRTKFIEELRKTGLTLRQFEKMREESLVIQYMRGSQAQNSLPPTPVERERIYQKNIDRFRGKDYVRLRTITISKTSDIPGTTPDSQKLLTEEIRAKALAGNDFASLAKAYSIDSKASNGGDWGTIERGDLKQLLSDNAFKLKPLTVSEVIEDDRNYYLLWVDALQRGDVTPLSEVREQVDQLVLQEQRKASYDKWIARLRDNATIKVFDKTSTAYSNPSHTRTIQSSPMPETSPTSTNPSPVVSSPPANQTVEKPAPQPEEKQGFFKRMWKKLPGT